ncbi:MAG: vanadium-dependent haloperoxidase [Acidobacteriota bacterium]
MHRARKDLAQDVREGAAQLAADRPHPRHRNNNEEQTYRDPTKPGRPPSMVANFTKGLPHDEETGLLLNAVDYKLFVHGIQTGDPIDFQRTPLGPGELRSVPNVPSREQITVDTDDRSGIWKSQVAQKHPLSDALPTEKGARVRAWESAGAGNVLDLEGPDAQAVTMPPAPRFDSKELVAEIAEVYAMALLRDHPFNTFPLPPSGGKPVKRPRDRTKKADCFHADAFGNAGEMLRGMDWFQKNVDLDLDADARARRRFPAEDDSDLFRGVTPGERVGPYLSQFLLLGNPSVEGGNPGSPARVKTDGFIQYGAIGIQQKVRIATPCKDYLTAWYPYVDVQNGADLRNSETYEPGKVGDQGHRFITTPRDLATYVHLDALYEAYLNACLFLLAAKAPFDRGIPFLEADVFDHQQGFAHFGGPHVLTLVTEVATRALKAVRYQKFNVHRRLRPEALGARIDRWRNTPGLQTGPLAPLKPLMDEFEGLPWDAARDFLSKICKHNHKNNSTHFPGEPSGKKDSYLLPMAFPEGSPMHPAYGAGHATVAGACVTILKAYFDHGWTPGEFFKDAARTQPVAYEASADGSKLLQMDLAEPLTVEGELNKLAANIAIGRNWAGVHFYTDYIESMRMGEQIALGLLEEQKLTYPEDFTMTVPLFDGGAVQI